MKNHLKLPGGLELYFEREPMDMDRFILVCALILVYMVGSGYLKLFVV